MKPQIIIWNCSAVCILSIVDVISVLRLLHRVDWAVLPTFRKYKLSPFSESKRVRWVTHLDPDNGNPVYLRNVGNITHIRAV
jgi:hypothetical protein